MTPYKPLTEELLHELLPRAKQGCQPAIDCLWFSSFPWIKKQCIRLRMLWGRSNARERFYMEDDAMMATGFLAFNWSLNYMKPEKASKGKLMAGWWTVLRQVLTSRFRDLFLPAKKDDTKTCSLDSRVESLARKMSPWGSVNSYILARDMILNSSTTHERRTPDLDRPIAKKAMQCLSEVESEIIRMMYGIGHVRPRNAFRTAKALGMGRQTVCYFHEKALKKMRKFLETPIDKASS